MACSTHQAIAMSARLAPSTVAHVLQLVGASYLSNGVSGSFSACRVLRHAQVSPRTVVKASRRFASSAQALTEEHDDYMPFVLTPKKHRVWDPRVRAPVPQWARLPRDIDHELFASSRRKPRPSPAQFRRRFTDLDASPTILLPPDRLRALFEIFSAPQTSKADWEWLLATITAAKKLKPAWHELPGSECLFRTLRGLALAHTGDWETARANVAMGIKLAFDYMGTVEQYPLHNAAVVEAYVQLVQEAGRIEDVATVVRYGGKRLQKLLSTLPPEAASQSVHKDAQRVRTAFQRALVRLDDPFAWLNTQLGTEPNGKTSGAVYHTAIVFLASYVADRSRTTDAFWLWRKVSQKFNSTFIPPSIASFLAANLAAQKHPEAAAQVLNALHETTGILPHSAMSRELWIYANQGKTQEAMGVWSDINVRHRPSRSDRLGIATAFGVSGNIDAARRALASADPNYESDPDALAILQRAAIVAEDADAALDYLNRIAAIRPTLAPFQALLTLYAQQNKTDDAIELFGRIVERGLKPTLECYTSFISVFANAGDHVNAHHIFESMVASGLRPDAPAWSALLNAYIEAGAWEEAAVQLERIPEELQTDPSLLTTLLKSYVLVAAPLEPVLRLFRTIRSPSAEAWALVIQSAADHNNLVLARSLFGEMDAATQANPFAPAPNVYVFSILLSAYLRTGDRESARAVYDTMSSRGIVPTSITYGILTNSYAQAAGESSFEQAHNFAMSVYDQVKTGERTGSRGQAVSNVFTPLLFAAARAGDIAGAKRYFDLITQNGGSSAALSAKLMDAYRRSGQLKPMYRIWLKLFNNAVRTIPLDSDEGAARRRTRNNVLCIPFSIVIRAFGEAGMHNRLKGVWQRMRAAGFGRDSQNYNHMAMALAQTGDIESAFHIVDRVLLPRYDEVRERYYRAMRPAAGLELVQADSTTVDADVELLVTEDEDASLYDEIEASETMAEGVLAPASSSKTTSTEVLESAEAAATVAPFTTDDVAEPNQRPPNRRHIFTDTEQQVPLDVENARGPIIDLQLLRSWRPSDILWRPSLATIATLEMAYRQLEDQRAYRSWMAMASDESDPDGDDENAPVVTLPDFNNATVKNEDGSPKRMSPQVMLARLNSKYARVVGLIMFHRRKAKTQRARADRERAL